MYGKDNFSESRLLGFPRGKAEQRKIAYDGLSQTPGMRLPTRLGRWLDCTN